MVEVGGGGLATTVMFRIDVRPYFVASSMELETGAEEELPSDQAQARQNRRPLLCSAFAGSPLGQFERLRHRQRCLRPRMPASWASWKHWSLRDMKLQAIQVS